MQAESVVSKFLIINITQDLYTNWTLHSLTRNVPPKGLNIMCPYCSDSVLKDQKLLFRCVDEDLVRVVAFDGSSDGLAS